MYTQIRDEHVNLLRQVRDRFLPNDLIVIQQQHFNLFNGCNILILASFSSTTDYFSYFRFCFVGDENRFYYYTIFIKMKIDQYKLACYKKVSSSEQCYSFETVIGDCVDGDPSQSFQIILVARSLSPFRRFRFVVL